MTGAQEPIGPDDGEAHGVLTTVANTDRLPSVWRDAVRTGMGSDEECFVSRVDAEPMNVNRAGIRGCQEIATCVSIPVVLAAIQGYACDRNGDSAQDEKRDQEPVALACP